MNDYIKYIINGMMCIAGGILADAFLVSDRSVMHGSGIIGGVPVVYYDMQSLVSVSGRSGGGSCCTSVWSQSRYAKYSPDGCPWLIYGHIHDSTTCAAYHFIKENLPCALNACFEINDHPATLEELIENNRKWYGR